MLPAWLPASWLEPVQMAYYSVQCQKFFASDLSCFVFDSDFRGGTGQLLCPGIRSRQRDGLLPACEIFDDVKTYKPTGPGLDAEILTSGFPCQAWSWEVVFSHICIASTWKLIDCSSHSFRVWAALACNWDSAMTDRSWCHNPSGFLTTCLVGRGLCFDWKLLKGFMCCFINW